jgi:hypothetical protein
MSKFPRPTGANPLFELSRAPGPLGVNDSASPNRPNWLLGDTPGPLGSNDHAAAIAASALRPTAALPRRNTIRWEKFLDSVCDWDAISGPPIAWQSSAHYRITTDAARNSLLREMLPPRDARRRLLAILSVLPSEVVMTDITLEQYSDSGWLGHKLLSQAGQATHFMANKGQSQRVAYAAGLRKIFQPAHAYKDQIAQQRSASSSSRSYPLVIASSSSISLAASASLAHRILCKLLSTSSLIVEIRAQLRTVL